ncbi:MAG: hypothetical protein H7Z11_15720 [Verrucomicrobia bacterium]|nr:hypothetical protein [Leptolyngbya sp. ES-bin-22]
MVDSIQPAQLQAYYNAAAARSAAASVQVPGSISIPSSASTESLRWAKNFDSAEAAGRAPIKTPSAVPSTLPSASEYSPYRATGVPNTNPASRYYPVDAAAGNLPKPLPPTSTAAPSSVLNPPTRGLPMSSLNSPVGASLAGGAAAGILTTGGRLLGGSSPLDAAVAGLGAAAGATVGGLIGAGIGSVFGPVGTFVGAAVGSTIGASLGTNLADGIMKLFRPAKAERDPRAPVDHPGNYPWELNPDGSTHTFRNPVRISFYSPNNGRVLTFSVTSFSIENTKDNYIPGTTVKLGADTIYWQSISATGVATTGIDVTSLQVTPIPGEPFPARPNVPIPRPDFGPLPINLPLTPPQPAGNPSPAVKPTLAPLPQTAPARSPAPTSVPTPTKTPSQPAVPENPFDPHNPLGPLGLLPFLPALMPATSPGSPGGSTSKQPGAQTIGQPPGSGQPPKTPTNTPCNSACQRAIEGRIQGVDDKMGRLLQTGNNAAQDAALAAILARLAIMDAKLGVQAAGGLSGFLSKFQEGFERFAKWMHLDRVLNVLTFATTLHNAYMLSNALTQTLFSMFSNVLAAIGLKDAEGSPLEIGKIVGSTIETFAKSILGVEAVDGFKKEWKKYSRIYQAAANIVYSIQSIAFSILSALEVVGSMVGKIGNALKAGGVIFEKAFGWMNVQPNFQNRFFTNIQAATDFVSAVDSVAGEVLSVQDAAKNLGEQKKDIDKALGDQEVVDNKAQKAVKEAVKPVIKPEDEQKPEA